ncbi:hypothetical protein V2J09_013682 [Rumex salicifolius]
MKAKAINPHEPKRDAYGFAVRPQHVQRYKEYANIYKEEEEERSDRWRMFIEQLCDSSQYPIDGLTDEADKINNNKELQNDIVPRESDAHLKDADTELNEGRNDSGEEIPEKICKVPILQDKQVVRVEVWSNIRPTLHVIECMMSTRVKKKSNASKGASEEDSEEEFYDVERSEPVQEVASGNNASLSVNGGAKDMGSSAPRKEELEFLVRGGLPTALRGELWQAFVGVKERRRERYYQDLLSIENDSGLNKKQDDVKVGEQHKEGFGPREKWKVQIEKDLPRTFPGHPALDEDGRNALRRLLIAYARHNPSVGYCQAMNFFAGLLLLLMPEENAFWTLVGILDDYFSGYYTEEMIESQVDQLVLEDLVRERFPKMVNHLDYLGVQIAWVTGPWFLSIFMNMLPWESVLRIWDVLLFEGNRVMLFRTALALMELYGPALVTTKDAGDAVTLLQSLVGSTFDSSQLVLTACMAYQNVHEARLKELREKHRPSVIASMEERSKGLQAWKNSKGLASKLYGFSHDTESAISKKLKVVDEQTNGDDYLITSAGVVDIDPELHPQEQIVWLKVELCKLLEEKRSAELRAEELETALMEMVKLDNRRELSARVEQLEQELSDLRRTLADKQEQEQAMLQVLMRVEHEQRVTEDARRFAEQDAEAQRYAVKVLQDKYEEAMASLAAMEKRVVMAESMLEATLQYQSGQVKAQASPRSSQNDSSFERSNQEHSSEVPPPARKIGLLSRPFNLGWRDRNKAKPTNAEDSNEERPSPAEEVASAVVQQKENNSSHEQQCPTETESAELPKH